jgi:hypothetical protein
MKQEKEQLLNQFEEEYLLFIDKDLPDERMLFWEQKIKEYPELLRYLEDYEYVFEIFNEAKKIHLDNHTCNEIVDKVIIEKSLLSNIKNFISSFLSADGQFVFGKIAFATLLIIGAIVISIISNRPNPVISLSETINAEVLEWDAGFVDKQISKMGSLLKITKDDEYRKYYKYNLPANDVDKNLNLINSNIDELKKELENKNL